MERGSSKHGGRQDDELAHEVEGMVRGGHATRAEEWRDPEPAGEDQPDVDRMPDGTLTGGTPAGMTADDVEARSRLAAALGKEIYPTTGEQAVERARTNAAPDSVVEALQRLEPGRIYDNLADIWSAVHGETEEERF